MSKLCCKALLHGSWATWITRDSTSWSQALSFTCVRARTHPSIISGSHHRETPVVRETRKHLFSHLPEEATVSIPLGEVPLLTPFLSGLWTFPLT